MRLHPLRPRFLLIAATLIAMALAAWYCLPAADNDTERRFVATLWSATVLLLGFASRRPWFATLAATALYATVWAASALKFRYLEMPAIAPDLYYFFSLDTAKVIAHYPLLIMAGLAVLAGIPLSLWLAWRTEAPADFAHRPEPVRRWGRRGGLVFAALTLAACLSPGGVFGEVYGKPMWRAVNDRSFITDFVISFYDTRIRIPEEATAPDASLHWDAAAPPLSRTARPPTSLPDIVTVLEESTFDPAILRVCQGNPLCRRAMFTPDSRTLAHGLLGVHTFGGGTWTAEFALITGLDHTLFGNAGLYAPYNLAPRVKFSIARSLKAQGYRVVALYPTSAEFLNGRNAYRDYGFDKLYDGADLGFPWQVDDARVLEQCWRLFQQEKRDHPEQPLFFMVLTLHQHGPHMTALNKLPPPYNKPLFPRRLSRDKGLDDWLNLNLTNYLQRNADSDVALHTLETHLLDRAQPTMLLHFGDHQPSFDGAMMVVDKTLPATWGEHPQWATYYMLKSNMADAPHFRYPALDIVYLGGLLLDASGIPENSYYTANRMLRERCGGRYAECRDPRLLSSYHDYVFRRLQALGT